MSCRNEQLQATFIIICERYTNILYRATVRYTSDTHSYETIALLFCNRGWATHSVSAPAAAGADTVDIVGEVASCTVRVHYTEKETMYMYTRTTREQLIIKYILCYIMHIPNHRKYNVNKPTSQFRRESALYDATLVSCPCGSSFNPFYPESELVSINQNSI